MHKLTPIEIRDKLKILGYNLAKHPNHMAAIHGALRSIRELKSHPSGNLVSTIREILREAGEL